MERSLCYTPLTTNRELAGIQDLGMDGDPMAAALVAKGSGDTDPRTLEVRLELGRGGLKGQCLGSTLTLVGTSAAPRALSKEASQLLLPLHSWPRG